uniref:Uncharacterized protein n=1 Tax=Ditylenchus dipsaci TaxID=166011 RepID=A0A915D4Z7_9BILA
MRDSSRSIWMVLLSAYDSAEEGIAEKHHASDCAPAPDKIDFTVAPLDCNTGSVDDIINKVKYSYFDGCNMDLIWKKENHFHTQKEGGSVTDTEETSKSTNIKIWIQGEEFKFQALNSHVTISFALFKAVTIEIPPVPAPIIETPSQRRPSAEFRRTLESRDETELAPNTVKLDRYERERSRRMLKAVDEGDQPRKKKSSSTIEDVM